VFPSPSGREGLLFERLFPTGLPPSAGLTAELLRRLRSGQTDLAPRPESGWLDYRVHALEALALPGRGEERDKLLLTRGYKERMREAAQALVSKRYETHLRVLDPVVSSAAGVPSGRSTPVVPRLRVEPCPSYYVRTGRACAFLADLLEGALGAEALRGLHGPVPGGRRPGDLYAELLGQRDLFYGLYLVSCEDVGLKPRFTPGEAIDRLACHRRACGWLEHAADDPDLACDARVAVPVVRDGQAGVTRAWATLGVRLARLTAEYARPPHLKSAEGGAWEPVAAERLGAAHYLIAVDEMAEVEVPGLRLVSREELRAACDRGGTRERILAELRRR
jgi:hypothetical protein